MTEDKDFKRVVRDRAAKTGESYATARKQLLTTSAPDQMASLRDQLALSVGSFWNHFRPDLRGLTDDEYLWQPVPGCPTVHSQPDGTFRADHQFPVQGAASIAQRLCWAAQLTLVDTNQHFGDKSVTWKDVAEVPGTAAGGVDFLAGALKGWVEGLAACPPPFLLEHSENRSPGAIDGRFPFIQVVLFHFQLLVQCCSQVSVARDLYSREHPEIVGIR